MSVKVNLMKIFSSLFLSAFFTLSTDAETIGELIATRSELSELHRVMRDTEFFTELNNAGNKKYTLFAPVNDAFLPNRLPSSVVSDMNSASSSTSSRRRLNDIFEYHTVISLVHRGGINVEYVTYSVSELQDEVLSTTLSSNKKLFLRTIDSDVYVNGAKILDGKSDLQADNGVVHMIDAFLHQVASSETALEFIRNDGAESATGITFTEFEQILIKYDEDLSSDTFSALDVMSTLPSVTIFAPSDDSLQRMNRQQLNTIKNSAVLLKSIVESHIITDAAYHGNILRNLAQEDRTIAAMNEHIVPKYFSNHLEVSNECAKGRVIHGNLTVFNGVIHVIDGLLGYVYADIIEALDQHGSTELASFLRSVDELEEMVDLGRGETPPAEQDMVTVFAPTDRSVKDADVSNGRTEEYDRISRMHMLQGRFDTSEMENGVTKNTLRSGFKASFYRIQDENGVFNTYVEVNSVRARILTGDICATNGIVHLVDHILGVPTMTISAYIDNGEHRDTLLSSRGLISSSGHDQMLNDNSKRLTFFAPSNYAIEQMREDSDGANILDRRNLKALRNVLLRHTIDREVIMSTQESRDKDYTTEFDEKITIVRHDDGNFTVQFKGIVVRVIQHDMRMTNGILHIVDGVLYGAPGASELKGASAVTTGSLTLLAAVYLLCIISIGLNTFCL